MLVLLDNPAPNAGANDEIIKVINSRVAGGRRGLDKEPSKVRLTLFSIHSPYSHSSLGNS